jgi:hypothetical protein
MVLQATGSQKSPTLLQSEICSKKFSAASSGPLGRRSGGSEGENGLVNRQVFEGLTWKVKRRHYRQDADSGGLTTSQENISAENPLIFEVLDSQLRISSKLKKNISDMLSI